MVNHKTTNVYTDPKDLYEDKRSPFWSSYDEVHDENDELVCYVSSSKKSKVVDNKPVHIGVAILQWSKLLFLRYVTYNMYHTLFQYFSYMFWLEAHLKEGSFKPCYADTDSMALALTNSGPEGGDEEQQLRSLFDPLVKPSMRDSWEKTWKDWFVTTKEIWDIRKPGKLKGFY